MTREGMRRDDERTTRKCMSRRVQVVEDDPDVGRLLSMQLAELGCECKLIDDGVSALTEAQASRYDR
jgi:CheY-like chemotaxis protein